MPPEIETLPYCRIIAMTQRNSSDWPNVPIIALPCHANPEGWAGSVTFQGRVGGSADERCGALASKNIFLRRHAASS